MLTKQLVILGAIAILPAFAQVSSAPTDMIRTAPRYHHPVRDLVVHGDGTATSTNWSGYAVTGTSFTSAQGSWIVPTATCKSGDQDASFWVGIDGYTSSTVEQLGTNSNCEGATPVYQAWYEFCCIEAEIIIPGLTISPGDKIVAEVTYSGTEFTLTIKDETTGKAFRKTGTISGAERSSAEWIAEAPYDGEILPLTDFGTVLFGEDSTGVSATNYAHDSTSSGAIGSFPAADITQITKVGSTSSPQTSTCTTLSSDGTSFSCTWAK
jgi:hypothetical protein